MHMNRKDQKKATRLELINSAKKVMFRKGIDETQISDITKTAGVSHGTFYVHFENKDEIVQILINDFNELMLEKVVAVFDKSTENDAPIDLKIIAETYLKQLMENREFIRIYAEKYGFSLPIDTMYEGLNPPLVLLIADKINNTAKSNEIADLDSTMLSHAILSMWLRIGIRYTLIGKSDDESNTISMLCRLTKSILAEFIFPSEI